MLLGCLLTALVFPGLLAVERVGVGRLLPRTAPLTGQEQWAEREDQAAALAYENMRIRREIAARPDRDSRAMTVLGGDDGVRRDPMPAVPARLLHRDASTTRHTFLIDAGTERGIDTGFAVAHANSIVGVVQTVAEGASRVVRIDDPSSRSVLPAKVLSIAVSDDGRASASERAGSPVARGVGEGVVIVSKLGADGARVGDLVVTGDGLFGIPAGLLIGEVVAFDDEDRDGEWEAVVRPMRDLDTIVAVYVCVRRKLAPHVAPRERSR